MIYDVIHVFLQSIVAVLKRIMISYGMCNHKIFAVIFYFAVLKYTLLRSSSVDKRYYAMQPPGPWHNEKSAKKR